MGVSASDTTELELSDLDQTLVYDGSGNLSYIQVVYRGNTYRQTLTYTSGAVTGVSRWVKQ